jgi:hypothetical protein
MKEEAASDLTFHLSQARPVSFTLLTFIGLSALLHAISFYLFQITYPPAAYINPPPAQVSVLVPGSEENAALARWIEAEDPTRASKPQEIVPAKLLALPYRPSYETVRAVPRTVEKPPAMLLYPAAIGPLALIRSALPTEQKAAPQPLALQTQLHFSGALAGRPVTAEPVRNLTSRGFSELRSARFLTGVSDRGEVRYVFLQDSSGDNALDAQAALHLQQMEFAHAAEPLAWGFATFLWGSEVFGKSSAAGPE